MDKMTFKTRKKFKGKKDLRSTNRINQGNLGKEIHIEFEIKGLSNTVKFKFMDQI